MGIKFSRLRKKSKKARKYNMMTPVIELLPYNIPGCACCSHFNWCNQDIIDSNNNNLNNVGNRSKWVY